jgi:hypothetical protein
MQEPFGFIFGFTAGLAVNLLSWWIIFRYIVPRIEFSSVISKVPNPIEENDHSGFRYRIKLQNSGRRGIIDVELAATLRIAGLTENIEIIQIPWSPDREKRARIIRLAPVKPEVKAAHVLRLFINSVEQFRNRQIYPEDIRRKAEQRTLTFEDLLGLGTRAWLQISAFGYDEFSGARKLFVSKSYTLSDIKAGQFQIQGLDVAGTDLSSETTNNNETQNSL